MADNPFAQYATPSGNPFAKFTKAKGEDSAGFVRNVNALGARTNNALLFGLDDDLEGIGSVMSNALLSPFSSRIDFDPRAAFKRGKARYQAESERIEREMPNATRLADIYGFIGSLAAPVANVGRAQTLGQMVKAGVKSGVGYGALSGVGGSDGDVGERIGSAAIGAGIGAGLGAAAPVLLKGAGRLVKAGVNMAGRGQPIAPKIIADRLASDAVTPRQAGRVIDEARSRGVPLALGDAAGENTRALLASVGRQPGPSRTIIQDMAVARQEGQADRLTGAITRDLGPITGVRGQSERLMKQAREDSRPLYEAAHAQIVPMTAKLRSLLQRPSVRSALSKAARIAAEDGEDATRMGFDVTTSGEVNLAAREPTMKTLDYIKRGLDDVVEGYRNEVTGRMAATGEARSVDATRKELLRELDRLNPAYRAARAAYAGPASANEALTLGQKALRLPPDDISRAVSRMGKAELEQFRLGVRASLSDAINAKGDYADKVRMLIGSPKKRAVLDRAFRDSGGIENFARTLADEERAQRTYAAVAGNSLTAQRLADDATTGDQGLINAASDAVLSSGSPSGMITGAVASVIRGLRDNRTSKLGEEIRGQIAAALAETNPAILRDALRNAQRAQARARVGAGVQKRVGIVAGRASGRVAEPVTDMINGQ